MHNSSLYTGHLFGSLILTISSFIIDCRLHRTHTILRLWLPIVLHALTSQTLHNFFYHSQLCDKFLRIITLFHQNIYSRPQWQPAALKRTVALNWCSLGAQVMKKSTFNARVVREVHIEWPATNCYELLLCPFVRIRPTTWRAVG